MRLIVRPAVNSTHGFCFFGLGCFLVCHSNCQSVCSCDCIVKHDGDGDSADSSEKSDRK